MKYKNTKKNNDIIFVDPVYQIGGKFGKSKLISFFYGLKLVFKHFNKINKFKNHFESEFMRSLYNYHLGWLLNLVAKASFYDAYSKAFTDEVLFNAVYINHAVKRSLFIDYTTRLNYARNLLQKYSSAKTVVTSRIHCALPCLGVETPVIFVSSESLNSGSLRSSGRFKGNVELMNTMELTIEGVKPCDNIAKFLNTNGKYDIATNITNSDEYKKLRDDMIAKVKSFLELDNDE